ncbi:MAG TPA: response regulator [Vicinamibacteria bacterium]|nr:response regulator [Vicinamibacteria bacterium]
MAPGGTVLIVDDNEKNLELLGDVLRSRAYRVRGALSGSQALKIAATRPPDLILLDLQMPDTDGYEVCRRLKHDPATREIPVIVISALDDVTDKVKAFEAGAVDYVTKPFQAPEVLSRVGAHLQLFQLQRDLERKNAELQKSNEELRQAQARTERVFSALAAALPGTVLDEKYRLDERIGTGGYGTVFRAEQLGLKRPVAVKVFRPWEGADNSLALERFRREGISACRLNHPNAVSVLDCGISSSGIAYLVMELLEGDTLSALLRSAGRIAPSRCAQILGPVCDMLAVAHEAGLVHRDIKPDNVFLHRTPRGDEMVKVLDFGIAKLIGDVEEPLSHTLTRNLVGTPSYVCPERLSGLDYDGRADTYSVGVMLYQMLSGRLPFPLPRANAFAAALAAIQREPPPLSDVELPTEVETLVMRALAKEPSRRPTAREMTAALKAWA